MNLNLTGFKWIENRGEFGIFEYRVKSYGKWCNIACYDLDGNFVYDILNMEENKVLTHYMTHLKTLLETSAEKLAKYSQKPLVNDIEMALSYHGN